MGFRFFKRVRIAPGVSLNLSKSGGSLSLGPRGAKVTVGPRGVRKTVGIPGSGLYYTQTGSTSRKSRSGRSSSALPAPPVTPPEEKLNLGFFKKLFTPANEKALVEGLKQLAVGNSESALASLENALELADSAFLAGVIALKLDRCHDAIDYLQTALSKQNYLGIHINKYGVSAEVGLPITDEISAFVGPNERGVRLALAEAHQALEELDQAIDHMRVLLEDDPYDVVIQLSLSELLLEAHPEDLNAMNEIMRITESVSNESDLHVALLLYKARALRKLNLLDAAKECLKVALAKKKDRSQDVLKAARYERALVYEDGGQKAHARKELEKLYSEDPDYEDVAKRLGLST